jgi:hypothetical protein
MHLDDGRVHLDGLNLDADDLFFLQPLKDLVALLTSLMR